jgi:hypothetical protein
MRTRREYSGALVLLVACAAWLACGQDLSAAAPSSGLAAWPKSRPLVFWVRGETPYTGQVQDVFIGDTRLGAPRGYPAAVAYANLWTLRAEWEHDPTVLARPNFFHLEKLRYDQISRAIVGTGTGGVADGYDARRKLIDCRRPEAALWIRSEAQRLIAGGFSRVFFDNTMMKVTGMFKPLNAQTVVSDAENAASMAAGTKAFHDECARMGRPMEMIINLAQPWQWTGAPRWQEAHLKVLEFWWNLGVRGVLLEKPEARDPASAGYQCNLAFGKVWLKRGGNLYVIIEDEARGAALARDLDSPNTWVWLRR